MPPTTRQSSTTGHWVMGRVGAHSGLHRAIGLTAVSGDRSKRSPGFASEARFGDTRDSASILRSILPFGLRGSGPVAHVDPRPGPCKPGSRSRHPAAASASSTRHRRPGVATTTIAWPSVGCGTPNAATSPTSCVRVEHLLDLGRADAVARRLDHLVAPADEVQEAFVVPAHRVAGEHRDLGQHQTRFAPGQRLVALGGLLGIVPVAHRHQRAAMHELAGLVGAQRRAVVAQDQDLGVRDRLADRVGAPVDLLGRQIGRAKRLGQAVHQERLASAAAWRAARSASRAACVRRCWRSSAGVRRSTSGQCSCASWMYSGGTAVRPVTRSLAQRVEHVARQQVVDAARRARRRGMPWSAG